MNVFRLSILTPDKAVLEGTAESLAAPGWAGDFAVLARHAPMVAAVRSGALTVRKGSEIAYYAVAESLVEVTAERVTVLTDKAVQAADAASARKMCAEWRM